MVAELALTLLITEWVPLQMQMWLLYDKYNLFYFLPKPMWFHFSLPQYYLCLKIKLSLTIKDWFVNFTKIRKKHSAKLSKWIANRVSQTVNSNPEYTFRGLLPYQKECRHGNYEDSWTKNVALLFPNVASILFKSIEITLQQFVWKYFCGLGALFIEGFLTLHPIWMLHTSSHCVPTQQASLYYFWSIYMRFLLQLFCRHDLFTFQNFCGMHF